MCCVQPTHLYSSTTVLKCQKGNCFDFSTLLCSMLIGSGYDAYCVNGYGSLDLCLMDLTREVCPLTVKAKEVCLMHGGPKNAQSWDCPSILEDQGPALPILREGKNCVSALIILREGRAESLPRPSLEKRVPMQAVLILMGSCSIHCCSRPPIANL